VGAGGIFKVLSQSADTPTFEHYRHFDEDTAKGPYI